MDRHGIVSKYLNWSYLEVWTNFWSWLLRGWEAAIHNAEPIASSRQMAIMSLGHALWRYQTTLAMIRSNCNFSTFCHNHLDFQHFINLNEEDIETCFSLFLGLPSLHLGFNPARSKHQIRTIRYPSGHMSCVECLTRCLNWKSMLQKIYKWIMGWIVMIWFIDVDGPCTNSSRVGSQEFPKLEPEEPQKAGSKILQPRPVQCLNRVQIHQSWSISAISKCLLGIYWSLTINGCQDTSQCQESPKIISQVATNRAQVFFVSPASRVLSWLLPAFKKGIEW